MDIEDLTKTQLILVGLLISFVSSIVVGITVVTLMSQEPEAVTQTINRVVQHTIEKVVSPAEPTKSETVVKQEDVLAQVIDKNSKNLVAIIQLSDGTEGSKDVEVGTGYIATKDGIVITGASLIDEKMKYKAKLGAKEYEVKIRTINTETGFAKLSLVLDPLVPQEFGFTTFGSSASLKVGKSVIAFYGSPVGAIEGIVSGFETIAPADPKDPAKITSIHLNLNGSPDEGALLIDSEGNLAGMVVKKEGKYEAIPGEILNEQAASKE